MGAHLVPIVAPVRPEGPLEITAASSLGFILPRSEDAQIIFCKLRKEEGEMFYTGLFSALVESKEII